MTFANPSVETVWTRTDALLKRAIEATEGRSQQDALDWLYKEATREPNEERATALLLNMAFVLSEKGGEFFDGLFS